jgi:hypothetical protein
MLTQKELKEYLQYNPDTGEFIWLKSPVKRMIGKIAGYINDSGYISIQLNNIQYRAHRLAFLYMKGSFPIDQVDHLDKIRSNNKWDNLVESSQAENQLNKHNNIDKRSGFTYIVGRSTTKTWTVRLPKKFTTEGKSELYIGSFKNLEEAIEALECALIKVNYKEGLIRFYKQKEVYQTSNPYTKSTK